MAFTGILTYSVKDGDNFWLPPVGFVDDNFRCWWWNSRKRLWEFKFITVVGSSSLGKCGLKYNHQEDVAKKLIKKGITHFMPHFLPAQ